MNLKSLLFVLILGILFYPSIFSQHKSSTVLSDGWKFKKGQIENAHLVDFNDADWENIIVPHDWAIKGPFIADGDGDTGKLPWKGEGWYRTNFQIPTQQDGNRHYLVFDGVMAFPKVYINGQLAGQWDYGYNSFYFDISDLVNPGGDNLLAVHADTRMHRSRWYPGGGIYRKVQLVSVHPIHIDIWGTYITTPIIKNGFADVQIATTVKNTSDKTQDITLRHTIYTGEMIAILTWDQQDALASNTSKNISSTQTLLQPRLWDLEDPYLYTVISEVVINEGTLDTYSTKFGIRSIRFTADHGFYLNDKRVQFKGVNLHHDHGPLGAAFNKRAMERQLQIMKNMGCNAIRTSHNTAAPEVLQLCDSLGILFFNEVFDKYDGTAGITDTTDFENFAHRNIKNYVLRDRNHPSVFLWSVGNEIPDVQWNENNGFHKLNTMVTYVKKYDLSRPVTLVCDSYKSAALRHFEYYDVHAWNYDRRYWLARQLEPNKSVIISESASTVSTRGFYEFPLPKSKTDFTNSLQVSSYDLHAPYWAEIADDDFMWQQDEPYIAGEFVWTGFDYLGEPTPYTNKWANENGFSDKDAARSSYFGIVDLCGIPKDRYYLYKSYWKPEDTTIHILPHWNWPDRLGKIVPVFVYTNGDCAELFLNGKSLGKKCKQPKSEKSTDRFRLIWENVIYEPGKIEVVAYKMNQELGIVSKRTTGEAVSLKLSPDTTHVKSNGEDLIYILIEAVDANALSHPLANHQITISIDGPGTIDGVCNGNPQSLASFKNNSIQLFYGKAMLIYRSGKQPGATTIDVTSPGLKKASITIQSVP